ncbi:MAG: glycosyltransferase [Candidatus Muiribacteriota bacterium]
MNILIANSSVTTFNLIRPENEIYISMKEKGHNIIILTQKDGIYNKRFSQNNIKVEYVSYKKRIDINTIKKIRQVIKKEKIDIVYATSSRSISNSIFACIGLNVKLVTYRGTTGGLYWFDPSAYLNALNPRVDSVICVSNAVRNHVLKKTLFKNKNQIVKINKGHDLSWYNKEKPLELSELNIDKNNLNVAFIGIVRAHKGFNYLLEAASLLKKYPNIHFIIIGKGYEKEPYKSEISRLKDKVHVLGYRDDVIKILKAFDVVIQPSFREGLSRVILESLSCGIPVIATNNEGNSELITDGKNGFLVPLKNSEAIAEKILKLYNEPETLKKLKQNAPELIKREMSHKKTVEQYLTFFEELISKN